MSLREQWKKLIADAKPAGEQLSAIRVSGRNGVSINAAVDREERRQVLIEIPASADVGDLDVVHGTRFTLGEVDSKYLAGGVRGFSLRLEDDLFEDIFLQLCENVITIVGESSTAELAVSSVFECIDRWKLFMERRRGRLSEAEVRGLIGELNVLCSRIRKQGAADALDSWRAPIGSLRDFEFPDLSLEVKTFSSSLGGVIRINDPAQLIPDGQNRLLLICIELAETSQDELTLSGHVDRARSVLGTSPAVQTLFTGLLASYGYLDEHSQFYTKAFRVDSHLAFNVASQFPRVDPAHLPAGIRDLRFSLAVGDLADFAVDYSEAVGSPHT